MSEYLTSRERKIMLHLLKANAPVTIGVLAMEIEVSRRTILRDLKLVDEWFIKKGYVVKRLGQNGLYIEATPSQKDTLIKAIQSLDYDHVYSPKERQTFMVTELLQSKELYKISVFAKALDVSEATISHDLDHVEKAIQNYQLTLVRKQGLGIMIKGSEAFKRKALMRYIHDELDEEALRKVIRTYVAPIQKQKDDTISHSTITQNLLELIDLKTIQIIEEAVKDAEFKMGFEFVESSYTALAIHLALAIKRLQNGDIIEMPKETLDNLKLFEEFSVATYLIRSIGKKCHLTIPDAEIGYITMHLKGARYHHGLYDESLLRFNELIISNYQLASMINEMLNQAEILTGYPLKKSSTLLVGLVDHIRLSINRIQMNLDIRNPLLEKIKENYADIYAVSEEVIQILEKTLNLKMPEAEIGYIAMHLGSAIESIKNKGVQTPLIHHVVITCTSGIGTSRMLAERIRSEFKNLKIIAILSSTQISEVYLLENDIDLIISTVSFDNRLVPVVTVNPLLLDGDIQKISHHLNQSLNQSKPRDIEPVTKASIKTLQSLKAISSAVIDLLSHLIIKEAPINQLEDLLDLITHEVTQNKNDQKTLKDDLQKRESLGSLIFKNEQVLFLHTRSSIIHHLTVQVIRHQSFTYQESNVQTTLCLLAPLKMEAHEIDVMSEISRMTVSDPLFLNDLKTLDEITLMKRFEDSLSQYVITQNQLLLK